MIRSGPYAPLGPEHHALVLRDDGHLKMRGGKTIAAAGLPERAETRSVSIRIWSRRMNTLYIKLMGCVELATGFGIITFWAAFYTVGIAPAAPPICYFSFEHSFSLAR